MSKCKTRVSKFDDRIYFDAKKRDFFHLKWDHAVDGVSRWWFTNYRDKWGYINGKLKPNKDWVLLGTMSEGCMSSLISKAAK